MAAPTNEQLARLGTSIRLSRQQFADIYDALVLEHGGEKLKLLQLMSPPDATRYFAALAQARDLGWFTELTERLLHADAFGEVDDSTDTAQKVRVDLQGIVQPILGFLSADLLRSGVIAAIRRVCRITIQKPELMASGTGFLVGPQAVLTSWHVVKTLLDGNGKELPGSEAWIRIEFEQLGGMTSGAEAKVAPQWLVGASTVHPLEEPDKEMLDFQAINQPKDFDKHLDYAVLRLATPVGRERGFYRLDRARKPCVAGTRTQITLFQHPAGSTLRVAVGAGTALWPPSVETRLRHTANSMVGSSGGLVLDADFQPIALHQCGFTDAAGVAVINGAIPTACIAANDEPFYTVIGPDPIWKLPGIGEPVIGREAFQKAVLNAAVGVKRIIAVNGDPKTGKSFSAKLLKAMLGQAEHSVVEFKAAELSVLPVKLAADLLARIAPDRHDDEPLPTPEDAETAQDAWIRDILFPAFVDRARKAAGNRIVWLVIDDLDANPLAKTASRHLLEKLYLEIGSLPFLRVVLIGLQGAVPAAPPVHVAYDTPTAFTLDEIKTYIERRSAERGAVRSSNEAEVLAKAAMNVARLLPGPRVPSMAIAVAEVIDPAID